MLKRFIHSIQMTNLLSFGPDTEPLELLPLNILIGLNGVGKSNLVEAIRLLRAAPKNLSGPVKESGGVSDWLWKGSPIERCAATITAIVENPEKPEMPLRHKFSFSEHGKRFEIEEEIIENRDPYPDHTSPYSYYVNSKGYIKLHEGTHEEGRPLNRDLRHPEESVLSQVKDPERYPYFSQLTDFYSGIRIYRDWSFGRYTPPRQPQQADLSSEYLADSCENLALVLNALRPKVRKDIMAGLGALYPEIEDFNIQINGGYVQLYLEEGDFSIPATRLSDGTLRFLCLLAILLNPVPPSMICLEEPELGLHPDILPVIAELMVQASEKTQLIVTTHSEILIDAMTERPETVVVCEKISGTTQMKRLNKEDLTEWLENYRLGNLWIKGNLGGTR